MEIHVRVNGVLAQRMGRARLTVAVPAGATVADVVTALRAAHPGQSAELAQVVAVVAGAHRPLTTTVENGQEVALLLPVAGG